jgi:hypothetical protein
MITMYRTGVAKLTDSTSRIPKSSYGRESQDTNHIILVLDQFHFYSISIQLFFGKLYF